MPLIEKEKSRLLLGIGIGAVGVVAAPFALPVLAAMVRPVLKELIKQSVFAMESGRERLAFLAEDLEDLMAETRSELEQELAARQQAHHTVPPIASAEVKSEEAPN